MKIILVFLTLLSTLAFSAESTKSLHSQFKSDLHIIVGDSPQAQPAQIDALADKLIKQIEAKDPSRFILTQEEAKLLAEEKQVISKEEFQKALAQLEQKATNPEKPKLLDWYLKQDAASGLNPSQRILAYRLIKSFL